MSKYGSISMKNFQLEEMKEVEKVLRKYNVSEPDARIIKDALKQAYYEWCQSNAHGCLIEEVMRQTAGEEAYINFVKKMMPISFGFVNQKMLETFAFYDE